MGSVKHLIMDALFGERFSIDRLVLKEALGLYRPPTPMEFGRGAWWVTGAYSVGDLKDLIPKTEIKDKAEALSMVVAAFFEYLANECPDIPTCYEGMIGPDGRQTDLQGLLQRGEKSNVVVMRLAHTPETFLKKSKIEKEDLIRYRQAFQSGELQCHVADVEAIFRLGFPLGSSTFGKICEAVGLKEEYEKAGTYAETVEVLDKARGIADEKGIGQFPELQEILLQYNLGNAIPNPGFMLNNPVYDNTTKFEGGGDRAITEEEAKRLSGLSDEGYHRWKNDIFPRSADAQISFAASKRLANFDGKEEAVAYRGMPVITDFACSHDENRLMIITESSEGIWAIPSNKEIQRGVFRSAGVYSAISEAKRRAESAGNGDDWRSYFTQVVDERKIDVNAVSEHSCNLMSYAIGEVANRILGKSVFDTKPMGTWMDEFMPYASKVERKG